MKRKHRVADGVGTRFSDAWRAARIAGRWRAWWILTVDRYSVQCSADNHRYFFDALQVKIRDEGAVRNKAIYLAPLTGQAAGRAGR
ncbi:hypothetical protein DIE08_30855 [Burkholderia sp. Bp9004]|nr:hypothetical protein DIE08_30855 [Burkholderia sp. Bp9004]